MSRDEGLAAALFALVIGVAVAGAIASDVTAPLCRAANIKSMAPDKIEFGCFEFWLNRYQTLIAAIIGAAIALYVVRPVFEQLRAMNLQSAFGAKQVTEELATLIDAEIEALREIDNTFFYVEAHFMDLDVDASAGISKEDAEGAEGLLQGLDQHASKIRQHDRRQLEISAIDGARTAFLTAYDNHRRACRTLSSHVLALRRREERAGETLLSKTLPKHLKRAEESKEAFDVKLRTLMRALEHLSRRKWSRVNELLNRADSA